MRRNTTKKTSLQVRSKKQLKRRIEEFVNNGRYGAALTTVEELRRFDVGETPPARQGREGEVTILDGLHLAASA